MSDRLTDKQLVNLYYGLVNHYNACCKSNMNPDGIYSELYKGVSYSLYDNNSSLSKLLPAEYPKVIKVLNTFFNACLYNRSVPQQPPSPDYFQKELPKSKPQQPNVHIHNHYYSRNDDFVFQYLLLDSLNRRNDRQPYYIPSSHNAGSVSTHNHPSNSNNKKESDQGSFIALLALLLLAAAAAVLAFIAMYYLLSETLNSLERFWYNEGWMQAALTLVSMPASTMASGVVAILFASQPLATLAVAAGVANPASWVVAGTLCLATIGGALGCYVTNKLQGYAIKSSNGDALDSADPYRFELTTAEADKLEKNGLDPVKVKLAMVALRSQMGEDHLPSLLKRLFSNDTKIQEKNQNLDKIRALRRGELKYGCMEVGDMTYDCKADSIQRPGFFHQSPQSSSNGHQQSNAFSPSYSNPPADKDGQYGHGGVVFPEPSAPPAYGSGD